VEMTLPDKGRPKAAANFTEFAGVASLAFLTLCDLFAAQAILPALTHAYHASPAMMSFAVNASTIGMAAGGLAIAIFGGRINLRRGIVISLAILTVPTLLLGLLPPLMVFTCLRISQGICMSTAFGLTLAYLGERAAMGGPAAFAAYVTGNVASNLIGRLVATGVASHFGLTAAFVVLASLNIAGALLAGTIIAPDGERRAASAGSMSRTTRQIAAHLRDPRLLAGFGIGFCILFAFIGTFTFVNFVLVRSPLSLGMMQVGLAYFVFLPAIFTTPLAGSVERRVGTRPALWAGLAVALLGLPLLLQPHLAAVLIGMVLVSIGTFLAQALATGYVNRTAQADRGPASGVYLASYFAGGLAGSLVLGQLFDQLGWGACVAGVAAAILAATALAFIIDLRPAPGAVSQ
jgi:YNFM family putative membrane transporter